MISGKTTIGFEFTVDETIVDDMRFFEELAAADENPLKIIKVTNTLLGEEQKEALYEFLEKKNGKASAEAFKDCLVEIMTKVGEANESIKNS